MNRAITIADVLAIVARYFDCDPARIIAKDRHPYICKARKWVYYLSYNELHETRARIGEALGGRDHSSITYGHSSIDFLLELGPNGLPRHANTARDHINLKRLIREFTPDA